MTSITTPSRRVFLIAAAACAATPAARAATHVDEADETAVALGYHHDASKVDAAKFPKHQSGQHCANCSFFQGADGDAWAGCAMFGRKQIAAGGWCNAWAKRPG